MKKDKDSKLYLSPSGGCRGRSFPRVLWLVACALLTLASCGEVYDLNGFDWEPETPLNDSVFNREITILNLQPYGSVGGSQQPSDRSPFDSEQLSSLFSLERFMSIHPAYKVSERWDLSLGGLGDIVGNNGAARGPGYGSSAIGGLAVLDTFYSKVMEVPADIRIQEPGSGGLDAQGTFSQSIGMVVYTYGGNFIRPDKVVNLDSPDPELAHEANMYAHMMYALSEDLIRTFPNAKDVSGRFPLRPRAMIVRTARGNYAKVELLSFYQDILDPELMRRGLDGNVVGFVSFRYMVIKADELRFGFVERRPPMTIDMSRGTKIIGDNPTE